MKKNYIVIETRQLLENLKSFFILKDIKNENKIYINNKFYFSSEEVLYQKNYNNLLEEQFYLLLNSKQLAFKILAFKKYYKEIKLNNYLESACNLLYHCELKMEEKFNIDIDILEDLFKKIYKNE